MILLDGRMPVATVGINDHRICACKSRRVVGPAIGIDHAGDAGNLVQTSLEQEAAGPVFVASGFMARLAGDEDDFFIRSETCEANAEENRKAKELQDGR